jgi:NADH-quinone oxidoreductase subunit N
MLELFSNSSPATPEILVVFGALVLLVLGAFVGNRGAGMISAVGGMVLVLAAVVSALVPLGQLFNSSFVMDSMAAFAKVAIFLFSALAIFMGDGWLGRVNDKKFEFPILVMLAALGMAMMVSAGDLIAL